MVRAVLGESRNYSAGGTGRGDLELRKRRKPMPIRIRPVPSSKSVSGSGVGSKRTARALAPGGVASGVFAEKSIAGFAKSDSGRDTGGTECVGSTGRETVGGGAERASMESALAREEKVSTTKTMARPRRHTHAQSLSEPGIRNFPHTSHVNPGPRLSENAIALPNGRRFAKHRFTKDFAN
jgi:hypothetical protein